MGLAPGQLGLTVECLLESAPDAILCIDRDGTIRIANTAAERIFGYGCAELVGNAVEMLVPIASRARHEQMRRSFTDAPARRDMGSSRRLSLFARRKDGSEFPAEISLSPAGDATSSYVTCIVRDVSERKKLEARALVSERLANAALLTAGLGHEIRNPLAATIANLEAALRLLPDGEEMSDARTAIEDALAGAHAAAAVTRELDLLSHPDRAPREPRAIDINAVVRAALKIGAVGQRAKAKVSADLRAARPVDADPGLLGQVLLNVLTNAGHAVSKLPEPTRAIRIRTWDDGELVWMEIADNGPGISRSALPRIFEPFFTTRGDDGTGIGLSIARSIVEQLGGRIAVDSSRGRGARFQIVLPAASSRPPAVA